MVAKTYKALAIDGGGTRCRLALVSDCGYEAVVSGSANACSNFDGTVHSILSGLEQLAHHASLPLENITAKPAYLGVSGVVDESIAARLSEALPFSQIKIEDDRPSALRGAVGDNNGMIAHCGTGSFFAAQNGGVQKFAGGWGPQLDDVAAAYWVGMRALSVTLYAFDGLEQSSSLTKSLLNDFSSTASIVAFASEKSSANVAQLAQQVTHHAELGDVNAIGILKQGASLISEKLLQLGWSKDLSLCLTGGIARHYKQYLPMAMESNVVNAKGEPIDGAVALARQFVQELSE